MRGAVALKNDWLANDTASKLAVYVVWSPQLGAAEQHVESATRLIDDARARHYWDGNVLVGTSFQAVLSLPAPAWDVWMLFDKDAVWNGDRAPRPAWWEHQLRAGPPELHLDSKRFALHADSLHRAGGK